MRHAVRPRAGPRRLLLVRSNRLNGTKRHGASGSPIFARNVIIVIVWTRSDAVIRNTNDRKGSPEVPGLMISNGPGAQYRRGLSVGPIHECADVSIWMRSRNHMLDPNLTGFDPKPSCAMRRICGAAFAPAVCSHHRDVLACVPSSQVVIGIE